MFLARSVTYLIGLYRNRPLRGR